MIDLLASASGGQPKGYAKTLYKGLNKQKKEMDKVKSQADEKLQLTNGDLIDVLPRFVPGVKLAREMRRWDAAKAEYRKQLAGLMLAEIVRTLPSHNPTIIPPRLAACMMRGSHVPVAGAN